MADDPRVILTGFADEAANQKTAVQQFATFAAIGLQYYSLRFIDVGGGVGYMLGNESDRKKAQAERAYLREEMNTVVVNVTNRNGSIVQVPLRKQGVGYLGTRGEYYPALPSEDQLRPVYGF